MSVFKVANSGGIRYSKSTKSIVIFSFQQFLNIKDVPYQDTWQGNTIQYTGQGKSGDHLEITNYWLIQLKTIYPYIFSKLLPKAKIDIGAVFI